MLLTGNEDALNPIIETIHELVDEIAPGEAEHHEDEQHIHKQTLSLVLLALGDALIGEALAKSLGLPRDDLHLVQIPFATGAGWVGLPFESEDH